MNLSPWATQGLRRRTFLRVAGGTAASATLALAGCPSKTPEPAPAVTTYKFTGNDTGQLNYFYALEQLLVAFYTQAQPANPLPGETDIISDLRDHHIVHLRALYYALNSAPAIGQLTYTFTGLTLNTRAGLFGAAQILEDLTLAAFNFSLPLLTSLDNLTLLVKLTSAQARHAATVRDLLDPAALAAPDAVLTQPGGLAVATAPTAVLAALAPYIAPLTFDGSLLPVV